jgi:hypothetical protein
MPFYDFEYFAGSNVIVKLNGQACLEAAAISYNYMDSKQPIYGYSSQLFDAVAPGQKLVQGSIVINYVYDNYLYDCVLRGLGKQVGEITPGPLNTSEPGSILERTNTLGDSRENYPSSADLIDSVFLNPGGIKEVSSDGTLPKTKPGASASSETEVLSSQAIDYEALNRLIADQSAKYWDVNGGAFSNEEIADATGLRAGSTLSGPVGRDVDPLSLGRGVEIQINYGNRGEYLIINSVHFVGRASAIQIDENVIVEEYSFFARQLRGSPALRS